MNAAMNAIEEGTEPRLDFSKLKKVAMGGEEVLPVAVQNEADMSVIMIGYVNREALEYTLKNRIAAFYSTSRNELWVKGRTSGDYLDLVDVRVNCEQNSLLYLVRPRKGSACHTIDPETGGHRPVCYYRSLDDDALRFI